MNPESSMSPDPSDAVDRYLDGLMEEAERKAFERSLEHDDELRAQVEFQARLDASLNRRFAPRDVPLADAPLPDAPLPDAPAPSPIRLPWGALAMAAVLVLAGAVAAYFVFLSPQRAPFDQPHEVYAEVVASGFEPREVCTTEAEFIDWMDRKFDQPMVIPTGRAGIELIGWDYDRILTPRTGILLARVDGEEVIVLVDAREHARRLRGADDLRLFRRDIGDVTLYEVTPLDEPRLVPLARIP